MIHVDRFAHLTGSARGAALALAEERERDQLRRLAELRAQVDDAVIGGALARIEGRAISAATVVITSASAASDGPPRDWPRNRAERRAGLQRRR